MTESFAGTMTASAAGVVKELHRCYVRIAELESVPLNDVRAVQRACMAAGIDPGPIDGIVGPLTRAAAARLRGLLDAI